MKAPLNRQSRPLRRQLFVRLIGTAFAVLILPLLYILPGLAGGLWIAGGPRFAGQFPNQIGLIAGPIHYDLLIPLQGDIPDRFAFADAAGVPVADPRAEWLMVGWGARGFYTATATLSDMEPATVWRAATGDSAVMRLDALGHIDSFESIAQVSLSDAEMTRLIDAVLASFADKTALPLPGFTATDAFFTAKGRFNLFNTCNVWVGRMLRSAGLPFGQWTPFPQSIRLSLAQTGLAGG